MDRKHVIGEDSKISVTLGMVLVVISSVATGAATGGVWVYTTDMRLSRIESLLRITTTARHNGVVEASLSNQGEVYDPYSVNRFCGNSSECRYSKDFPECIEQPYL